jgi:hypothetical protein
MDNPVAYALAYARRYIPVQILEATYMTGLDHRYRGALSLDDQIRSKVIFPIVVTDSNLIGGTEVTVEVDETTREFVDSYSAVYQIPKEQTNNRAIVSVLSVSYGLSTPNMNFAANPNGDFMMKTAAGMWWSNVAIPVISTARSTLVGENKVLVKDNIALPPRLFLRCWLENPEDYSHIPSTMYREFARLCELAIKADIYNRNIVAMDQGILQSGQELGSFRTIVESYSDAQENYWTYFNEEWQGVLRAGDFEANMKYIKLALGGRY